MSKCPELKTKIHKKKSKTIDVVNMRPEKLWPDGPCAKAVDEKIHKEMRQEFLTQEFKNQDGFFTCNTCKSKKTTYYPLQTRSAEEPMTTFVSCLNCGKH